MKTIGYIRVSTRRQGDSGLGLESQEAIIKNFYPDCEEIFCDIMSGSTADRPELKRAIQYCKTHNATLVVAKADRLSRNVKDALEIYDQLNGNIRFCDIPGEPEKFIITIHFAIAERELELISIRIRAALKARKARGLPLGLHILESKDGRKLDPQRLNKQKFRTDSADAKHQEAVTDPILIRAKQMAESLRAAQLPLHTIADKLNASHFTTRSGGAWSKGTVSRLLKRANA